MPTRADIDAEVRAIWDAAPSPDIVWFHPRLYDQMVGAGMDPEKITFVSTEGRGVTCLYESVRGIVGSESER